MTLSSIIVSLKPMLDGHGVVRVKGHTVNPPVADAARNQAILPRDHPVTALIVCYSHESIGHLQSAVRPHSFKKNYQPFESLELSVQKKLSSV